MAVKGISFCSLPALSWRWLSVRTPFHCWRDRTRLHSMLISRTYFQSSFVVVPGVNITRSLPLDYPSTLNGCTYYKLGSCFLYSAIPHHLISSNRFVELVDLSTSREYAPEEATSLRADCDGRTPPFASYYHSCISHHLPQLTLRLRTNFASACSFSLSQPYPILHS